MNIPKPPAKGKPNTGMMPNQPIVVVKPRTPKDNRRPVSPRAGDPCPCHEDDLVFTHVSGYDGVIHPVGICKRCKRISFDDDATHTRASKGEDVFAFRGLLGKDAGKQKRVGSFPAAPRPSVALMKALGGLLTDPLTKGYIDDPEAHGLRWITVHPNGDDSKGVPILVHDNGTEYTVVGGAGGKMNQMVLKKPKSHASDQDLRRQARKEKRQQALKEKREAMSPERAAWEEKVEEERAKKREEFKAVDELLREHMGLNDESAKAALEREARKRALLEKPGASPAEVKEYIADAEKQRKHEEKVAVTTAVNKMVEDAAKKAAGDGGAGPTVVKLPGGGKITLNLDDDVFNEAMTHYSAALAHGAKARAIERALNSGDEEAVKGVEMLMTQAAPSESERQALVTQKYLDNQSVEMHTRLVRDSEGLDDKKEANSTTVARNQRNGAADALNNYVNDAAGAAILSPEAIRTLGVENAARVAAAYLTKHGHNSEERLNDLLHRVAVKSTAAIAARFEQLSEMQANVDSAHDSAYSDDDTEVTLTKAQANIVKANFAQQKVRLLNTTRGQLRSAAALAYHMEHHADMEARDEGILIDGGTNAVAAHSTARGLGLSEGDYTVEKAAHGTSGEGGSYKIKVAPGNIHKLAHEHTLAEHQRNMEMENLRQDVEDRTEPWNPEGFNENISLMPHQELAAKAICQQKRMVLNLGRGTGKTAAYYAAAAHLLSIGAIDKCLMVMPAKPRSQQEDGFDETTGQPKQGERKKFLDPEMADQFVTVTDVDQLVRVLKKVKNGSVKGIITTPAMMRAHRQKLKDAGFGGDKSMFIADEVHDYGVLSASEGGTTDAAAEKATGQAKACREFSSSEYFVAGSGTLIRKSAADLHDVYDMVAPGELGSRQAFKAEWERLARGRSDVFSDVGMAGMRARLSGYTVTYHKDPTREDGEGGREAVPLIPAGDNGKEAVNIPLSHADKTRIRKVLSDYEQDRISEDANTRKAAAIVRDGRIRRICNKSEGKHGQIVDDLHDAMEHSDANGNHKALIYATETRPLAALKKRLAAEFPNVPIVEITGGENDVQTRKAMDVFNGHDGHVICLATAAANYGVNLQGGKKKGTRAVYKLETPATVAMSRQIDGRLHREGQDNDVTTRTYVADHHTERSAYYRVNHVQGPQQDLLADLATPGGYSHLFAPHMDDLRSIAHA